MATNNINARQYAAHALADIIEHGQPLTTALPKLWKEYPAAVKERAFIQEVCYGVMRWFMPLNALNQMLLRKPVKTHDYEVQALILIGLYQLNYMRVPDYAAVSETVAAARAMKKPWAVGFINGLLRHYLNNKAAILEKLEEAPEFTLAHPSWMLDMLQHAWPDYWEKIVEANNTHPPLCIRVNQLRTTRDDYLKQLDAVKISGQPIPYTTHGIQLDAACDVNKLPGFSEGLCFIQDGSAQLAPELLDLQAGQRVLDACAAPGGKTTHILEAEPKLSKLIALDKDQPRLAMVEDNLKRLGLSAECICGDANTPEQWWDKQPFDRILLDAPCSATGVIRRHPDIKWLRRQEDIFSMAKQQKFLLESLWPLLKPKGLLVYATCSIIPQENALQIENFLKAHQDAQEVPIMEDWGIPQPVGRQILPHPDNGMDGFYYAVLRKTS